MTWPFIPGFIARWVVSVQRIALYFLTGKSQLEQIITNRTLPFPLRVHQIEQSLNDTSSPAFDDRVAQMKLEKKNSTVHDQLYVVMHKLQLYRRLVQQIEIIRKTKVSPTEPDHVELLDKVWSRLVVEPDEGDQEMQLRSKRWTKIGFQGLDPMTDFRGMGLLGLQCIEYLSRNRSTCLTYVHIQRPNDYSFAIGAINITSWLVHLLEIDPSRAENNVHPLQTHFSVHPCNLNEFFLLFSLVFAEWHQFWLARKANIMQFEQLSKIFRAQMLEECQQWRPIQRGFAKEIYAQQ